MLTEGGCCAGLLDLLRACSGTWKPTRFSSGEEEATEGQDRYQDLI
jgi:hypothetical protein